MFSISKNKALKKKSACLYFIASFLSRLFAVWLCFQQWVSGIGFLGGTGGTLSGAQETKGGFLRWDATLAK